MTTRKRLMVLGAGVLQRPAILAAKELGLEVIAVDMDPLAIEFQDADIRLVLSTNDIPGCVQAGRDYQINGVMTLATDLPVRTVAAVSETLGVVGVSRDVAARATDKGLMRECLRRNGVPVPDYVRTLGRQEFGDAIARFRDGCIVKPSDSSGSRGVVLLTPRADVDEVESAFNYSRAHSRTGEVLVEEFMRGPEVSVETLSHAGQVRVVAITDKLTTGAPHFVELGHSQPSQLDATAQELITSVAVDAVTAIGIQDGPAHVEIILTEQGPKIVELGARLGGDNIATHLVPLSTGVDLVKSSICVALGDRTVVEGVSQGAAAIRYITADRVGAIRAIRGVDSARGTEGVEQVTLTSGPGDICRPLRSSADRLGFVIAHAVDAPTALQVCRDAISRIEVDLEQSEV